jgi:SAM-dependent methyltransferase
MKLLSHAVSEQDLEQIVASARARIVAAGDKPHVRVDEQLAALEGLMSFELGRFMLKNRGLNGFWTEYVCSYPARKARGETAGCGPVEVELLEAIPGYRATQERYAIFRSEIRKRLQGGEVCAALPCGLMTEFLLLPPELASRCRFVGMDLDPESLAQARAIALTQGLIHRTEFRVQDAWALPPVEEFDLISSNGLNIYVPEDEKVVEFYRGLHAVLKPGGVLITSTVSPSPDVDPDSTWKMGALDPKRLRRQVILFVDVMQAGFMHARSVTKTRKQLEALGFRHVEFIPDSQGLFPTVIATK